MIWDVLYEKKPVCFLEDSTNTQKNSEEKSDKLEIDPTQLDAL